MKEIRGKYMWCKKLNDPKNKEKTKNFPNKNQQNALLFNILYSSQEITDQTF
jgi:hypothetical protein